MKTMKGKFKRILAGILSFVMLLGVAPMNAFAAGNTVSMSFGPSRQSDGTLICYHGTFVSPSGLGSGSADGTINRKIIYADGEEAYCIQPGVHLNTGDVLTKNTSSPWNALSNGQKEGIKLALAYGKPGNSSNLSGSAGSQYVATQVIVWEFVNGWRNTSTYERTNSSIIDAFCNGGHNAEMKKVYNQIVSKMKNHKITPSFADGTMYEMAFANGEYSLTLKDSKGVLSEFAITSSDPNVKVARNGNSIRISSNKVIDKDAVITFTKSSSVPANATLVAYGHPTLQDVIMGLERPADVKASLKVSGPAGTMKIVKTSEDGKVEGVQMILSGNGFTKAVTTGTDGVIEVPDLYPGTYTVTEKAADYYEPQEDKQVTIKAGKTTEVSFSNVLKRGDVTVFKTSEDGFKEGMKFRLFGTSASGEEVEYTAVTDESGKATFHDVLIAGAGGYTLEEVDAAVRYVIPDDQNVKVFWKEETETSMKNVLKKFIVTVHKEDTEMSVSQGNATLAGAVYGLYKDGELVETMTTDEKGNFTTSYHVCGPDWSIREITPSEGYLLDETIYPVGAEPENYTVELNQAPDVTSKEQVIKGSISIIKHMDDGSTQIETPEEGAAFDIYLSSAGSYEAAKETERDQLICDESGFAISKDLPYGMYTVHQTAGAPETEFMKDFTVFVSQDGHVYKYLINNAPYSAYIKVVKADKETGNVIPLSGAGFEIYDASGEKVIMSYTYPTLTSIDTFYVSEEGYLITPQVLPAGEYSLVEVQAPYGYVLDKTPIPFTVTMAENEELEGLNVITVTAHDMAQKGIIRVEKTGEMFASVMESGSDKEGFIMYQPVYETKGLAGAKYQVIAIEDVITGDGTIRYKAGEVVDEIVTGEDGKAHTKELYLGRYQIVEVKAPEGYVVNTEPAEAELVYAGQEISITEVSTGFDNDRQKVQIDLNKQMEVDETFGLGMNDEVSSVAFGLYAKEEIKAQDGTQIPKDGLVEIRLCEEDGSLTFQSDLPFGSYYIKEMATDPHYLLNGTVYGFSFTYAGQEVSLVQVKVPEEGKIENVLKRGTIKGNKVDGEEKGLSGAVFGLFDEWETDYTEENAFMTAVSLEDGSFSFENVPYGDYVVLELSAPEGYVRSDARHFVSVTYDTQVIGIKAINHLVVGSVQLTKVDAEYPENKLTGAVFEIFIDTDEDGKFDPQKDACLGEFDEISEGIYEKRGLLYGDYFVREKTAPEGFLVDEGVYPVSIVNDKDVVIVENEAGVGFMDQPIKGNVTVFKTDTDTKEKLAGAGFRICDTEGNAVAEGYTGEEGTVSFELRYGKYTVAEFEAPKGYVLDEAPYSFEVTEHGQKISIDMANTKIKGKIVISKVDADTEELLPDAGFRIYDVNGEVIREGRTDKNGNVEFDLEFGTYYYQEFDAPEGYEVNDEKYEFTITEDGQVVSVVMTNKKTVTETPKEETPKEEPTPERPILSTDSPKTGDEADLMLWGILAGCSALIGIGFGVFAIVNREKKQKKGN